MSYKQPSEKYIRETIELILSGESHRLHREHIWLESAWPFMIEALRDERADEPIDNTGRSFAAFVLEKLSRMTPIPFEITMRFIDSPICGLSALRAIGNSGTAEGGAYIGQLLASDDHEAAKRAIRVLDRASCKHPGESGFLDEVWKQVRDLLRQKPEQDHSRLFRSLIKLDRDQALLMLDELGYFRVGHPGLEPILRDVKHDRIELGVARLTQMVEALYAERDTRPNGLCLMYALPCLARESKKLAKPWLQRIEQVEDDFYTRIALEMRLVVEGLDNPTLPDLPHEAPERINKLHRVHRSYLLAQECDILVMHGGINGFLTSSSGLWSNETVQAFREIGADAQADLLEEAIAAVGKSDASWDDVSREGVVEVLRAIESRYFDLNVSPDLEELLMRYQLKHKRHFRSRRRRLFER